MHWTCTWTSIRISLSHAVAGWEKSYLLRPKTTFALKRTDWRLAGPRHDVITSSGSCHVSDAFTPRSECIVWVRGMCLDARAMTNRSQSGFYCKVIVARRSYLTPIVTSFYVINLRAISATFERMHALTWDICFIQTIQIHSELLQYFYNFSSSTRLFQNLPWWRFCVRAILFRRQCCQKSAIAQFVRKYCEKNATVAF